ncbi:MAG: hypothetical protein AB7S38_14725 [Vulcanimicrobiota bacterium]
MEVVNVVVTCSNRKSLPVSPELCLGGHRASSLAERAASWLTAIGRAEQRAPARQVYCGGHWHVVAQLERARVKVDLWVTSAGYGLIHADDPIASYQSTFSTQTENSVFQASLGKEARPVHRDWWSHLARWPGPAPGRPRSLEELAAKYPRRPMLVALSSVYLGAIGHDLARVPSHLDDRLMIVSRKTHLPEELHPWVVPFDARLQDELGGARQSLYARVVRKMLDEADEHPLRLKPLQQRYQTLLAQAPPVAVYNRTPLEDGQVRAFIKTQLKKDQSLRHTRALRDFRSAGLACEQKRFANLFAEVRQEVLGG